MGKVSAASRSEASQTDVFGGSAGDQLEEDVSLLAAAGDDARDAEHGEVAGDLKRADAASCDKDLPVGRPFEIAVLKGVRNAAFAGEGIEPGDRGNGWLAVAT